MRTRDNHILAAAIPIRENFREIADLLCLTGWAKDHALTFIQRLVVLALIVIPLTSPAKDTAEYSARDFVFEEETTRLAARFALQLYEGDFTREASLSESFHTGDRFRFVIRPSKEAYIFVINVNSKGRIKLVWPNEAKLQSRINLVHENQANYVPSNGKFRFSGPTGNEWLLVVLSTVNQVPNLDALSNDLPKYGASPGEVFEYQVAKNAQSEEIFDFWIRGDPAITDEPHQGDPGTYAVQIGEGEVTLVYPYLLKHKPK